jgi:hypothetical protein
MAAETADAAGAVAAAPAPAEKTVPWEAPQDVLYDNGPLVTHPSGGFGGADASALQTALLLSTYGFGNQVSAGNRIADDFTVTDAAGWYVDKVTFFGYQTGSTTASTFTGVNLRIWDGPPNNPASSVVFGDTTTNRLMTTSWSNIYRVLDTALTNTQRPVMANEASVGTFLPAGTYWLDWQADGTLASGPWAPPISILGQTTTGNALQFTSTGWAPAIDTGAGAVQGFPFVVEGTVGGTVPACSAPADIPWLSLSATSGTTAPAGASTVDVTFDSTGLAVGVYLGNLCITSNDPDPGPGNGTDLVIVPVTLTVQVPTAVRLSEVSAEAGQASAPLSVPVGALPAAMAAAMAAAYVLRRRR